MKLNKVIITAILGLIASTGGDAQQEAMYSQFVYNKQQLNPAYTGSKETMTITLHHRSQWVGFKGAPMTSILSFETPLSLDELAVGATIMHDKIGPTSEITVSGDIAYRLRLRNRSTLAFGGKATVGLYQANYIDLDLTSDHYGIQDEFFMTNPEALILPNAGFGMYWYDDDYYISLSSPKMLRNKLETKGSQMYDLLNGRTEPTVYLAAGKNFKVNRYLDFQPNLMVRGTMNAPLSMGAYLAFIYIDQLTIGGFYNFKEVAGGVVQWQADNNWKIGYSVDIAISELITTNYGSHEIMVNYSFGSKRKRIFYPRYF